MRKELFIQMTRVQETRQDTNGVPRNRIPFLLSLCTPLGRPLNIKQKITFSNSKLRKSIKGNQQEQPLWKCARRKVRMGRHQRSTNTTLSFVVFNSVNVTRPDTGRRGGVNHPLFKCLIMNGQPLELLTFKSKQSNAQ